MRLEPGYGGMNSLIPSDDARRTIPDSSANPEEFMGLQHLTITLPDEVAERVRAKVASGEYATESDLIRDGIERLVGRDQAFESWLVNSVGPAYDELRKHPERGLSAEQVLASVNKALGS
jgi:antitoxin ParD1/3/4